MHRCPGTKRDGSRCTVIVEPTQTHCWWHDPANADERKRAASKGGKRGGRGRPSVELVRLQARFELLDGSRYYYDPASWELFMHWYECLGETSTHNWPEAPEVIRKLCEAKDPQAALDAVMEEQRTFGTFAYDPDILVNERRLEPWGLVGSYTTHRAENIASGTPTTPRSRTSPSKPLM